MGSLPCAEVGLHGDPCRVVRWVYSGDPWLCGEVSVAWGPLPCAEVGSRRAPLAAEWVSGSVAHLTASRVWGSFTTRGLTRPVHTLWVATRLDPRVGDTHALSLSGSNPLPASETSGLH